MANHSSAVVIPKQSAWKRLVENLRPTTPAALRFAALRRFAIGITILTVAGHAYLGFEQSIAQPLVAVLVCYLTDLFLETVTSRNAQRRPAFVAEATSSVRVKVTTLIDFLLPAHISGLALGMLLYASNRLDLFVVAAVVAMSSKYCFRVWTGKRSNHYFNPSNFGIVVMILLFPETISIAAPYQFTENLGPSGDIILPIVVAFIGLFLNIVFTVRVPLIAAWIGGFVLQAAVRSAIDPLVDFDAALAPLTGMAVILFTLYMVTDPGTTPRSTRGQIIFGLSVAFVYGLLMVFHMVFGVFVALVIVCACRGILMAVSNRRRTDILIAHDVINGAGLETASLNACQPAKYGYEIDAK
ncbi:MAG: RnfABCDGE type electron transport complex subunit D [Ketobacter sp.]|nr:RnfABCDGE type electron transport complex subunit D [Ketobacter sp.]